MSSSLAQGVCPRVDTLARMADVCGYELVIVSADVASKLASSSGGIIVEYDGR